MPPIDLSLVIGGIALPLFAEAILWCLHKVGVGSEWDTLASLIIAAIFAVLVLTMNFYPQYSQPIVGAVSFLYTLILTLQKFFPQTVGAVRSLRK